MVGTPKTRDEVIAISHATADEYGIPRLLLLGCGVAEGNLVWNCRRPSNPDADAEYWPDVSGGVWQQTVRYDPNYRGGDTYPGATEIDIILHQQFDVQRAANVAAAQLKSKWNGREDDDSLLQAMYRYNWPSGGGKPYTVAHERNYRRGLAEAKEILSMDTTASAGHALRLPVPSGVYLQTDDWSCSVRSLHAALFMLGVDQPYNETVAWLVPQYVTPAEGLLSASGVGLVAALSAHGFFGGYRTGVSIDDVRAKAGKQPVMIGSGKWGPAGHWTAVTGVQADGTLELANPAGTYQGIGPILRDSFARLGPWSMVWVDWPADAQPAPPPPPVVTIDEVAQLKAEIARLKTVLGYATIDIGAALRKEIAAIRAEVDAIEAAVNTLEQQR